MKFICYLFFATTFLLGLCSCDNITEEIHINADGSGKYIVYTDAIPSMRMMITEMSKAMMSLDSLNNDSIPPEEEIEEELWKDFPHQIDSTFTMAENMPDSLQQELEKYPHLKKVEGFMEGGRDKGYMNSGLRFSFDDIADMELIIRDLEQQQKKAGEEPLFAEFSMDEDFDYSFENNVFRREYRPKPQGEVMQENEIAEFKEFFGKAAFITKLKFEKKIRKVKGDHLLSQSDHEVIFQYDLLKMMNGEQDLSFEIYLK